MKFRSDVYCYDKKMYNLIRSRTTAEFISTMTSRSFTCFCLSNLSTNSTSILILLSSSGFRCSQLHKQGSIFVQQKLFSFKNFQDHSIATERIFTTWSRVWNVSCVLVPAGKKNHVHFISRLSSKKHKIANYLYSAKVNFIINGRIKIYTHENFMKAFTKLTSKKLCLQNLSDSYTNRQNIWSKITLT